MVSSETRHLNLRDVRNLGAGNAPVLAGGRGGKGGEEGEPHEAKAAGDVEDGGPPVGVFEERCAEEGGDGADALAGGEEGPRAAALGVGDPAGAELDLARVVPPLGEADDDAGGEEDGVVVAPGGRNERGGGPQHHRRAEDRLAPEACGEPPAGDLRKGVAPVERAEEGGLGRLVVRIHVHDRHANVGPGHVQAQVAEHWSWVGGGVE